MTAAQFLIEDDRVLLGLYPSEKALPFPFAESEQRIGYADVLPGSQMSLNELKVRVLPDRWTLSTATRHHTATSFDAWMATRPQGLALNSESARLAGCAEGVLTFQSVSYEDYARSNLVMDHRPTDATLTLREAVTTQGAFEPLAQSSLANPLGISLIAINQDGEIPLQIRAQNLAVRPGEVCSTSSGTFEVSDIPAAAAALRSCNLLRETVEEMGSDFSKRLSEPEVLGLAREFARGGQPELFLLSKGNFARNDVFDSLSRAKSDGDNEVHDVIFLTLPRQGDYYLAEGAVEAIAELQATRPIAAPLRCHLAYLFAALARYGMLR